MLSIFYQAQSSQSLSFINLSNSNLSNSQHSFVDSLNKHFSYQDSDLEKTTQDELLDILKQINNNKPTYQYLETLIADLIELDTIHIKKKNLYCVVIKKISECINNISTILKEQDDKTKLIKKMQDYKIIYKTEDQTQLIELKNKVDFTETNIAISKLKMQLFLSMLKHAIQDKEELVEKISKNVEKQIREIEKNLNLGIETIKNKKTEKNTKYFSDMFHPKGRKNQTSENTRQNTIDFLCFESQESFLGALLEIYLLSKTFASSYPDIELNKLSEIIESKFTLFQDTILNIDNTDQNKTTLEIKEYCNFILNQHQKRLKEIKNEIDKSSINMTNLDKNNPNSAAYKIHFMNLKKRLEKSKSIENNIINYYNEILEYVSSDINTTKTQEKLKKLKKLKQQIEQDLKRDLEENEPQIKQIESEINFYNKEKRQAKQNLNDFCLNLNNKDHEMIANGKHKLEAIEVINNIKNNRIKENMITNVLDKTQQTMMQTEGEIKQIHFDIQNEQFQRTNIKNKILLYRNELIQKKQSDALSKSTMQEINYFYEWALDMQQNQKTLTEFRNLHKIYILYKQHIEYFNRQLTHLKSIDLLQKLESDFSYLFILKDILNTQYTKNPNNVIEEEVDLNTQYTKNPNNEIKEEISNLTKEYISSANDIIKQKVLCLNSQIRMEEIINKIISYEIVKLTASPEKSQSESKDLSHLTPFFSNYIDLICNEFIGTEQNKITAINFQNNYGIIKDKLNGDISYNNIFYEADRLFLHHMNEYISLLSKPGVISGNEKEQQNKKISEEELKIFFKRLKPITAMIYEEIEKKQSEQLSITKQITELQNPTTEEDQIKLDVALCIEDFRKKEIEFIKGKSKFIEKMQHEKVKYDYTDTQYFKQEYDQGLLLKILKEKFDSYQMNIEKVKSRIYVAEQNKTTLNKLRTEKINLFTLVQQIYLITQYIYNFKKNNISTIFEDPNMLGIAFPNDGAMIYHELLYTYSTSPTYIIQERKDNISQYILNTILYQYALNIQTLRINNLDNDLELYNQQIEKYKKVKIYPYIDSREKYIFSLHDNLKNIPTTNAEYNLDLLLEFTKQKKAYFQDLHKKLTGQHSEDDDTEIYERERSILLEHLTEIEEKILNLLPYKETEFNTQRRDIELINLLRDMKDKYLNLLQNVDEKENQKNANNPELYLQYYLNKMSEEKEMMLYLKSESKDNEKASLEMEQQEEYENFKETQQTRRNQFKRSEFQKLKEMEDTLREIHQEIEAKNIHLNEIEAIIQRHIESLSFKDLYNKGTKIYDMIKIRDIKGITEEINEFKRLLQEEEEESNTNNEEYIRLIDEILQNLEKEKEVKLQHKILKTMENKIQHQRDKCNIYQEIITIFDTKCNEFALNFPIKQEKLIKKIKALEASQNEISNQLKQCKFHQLEEMYNKLYTINTLIKKKEISLSYMEIQQLEVQNLLLEILANPMIMQDSSQKYFKIMNHNITKIECEITKIKQLYKEIENYAQKMTIEGRLELKKYLHYIVVNIEQETQYMNNQDPKFDCDQLEYLKKLYNILKKYKIIWDHKKAILKNQTEEQIQQTSVELINDIKVMINEQQKKIDSTKIKIKEIKEKTKETELTLNETKELNLEKIDNVLLPMYSELSKTTNQYYRYKLYKVSLNQHLLWIENLCQIDEKMKNILNNIDSGRLISEIDGINRPICEQIYEKAYLNTQIENIIQSEIYNNINNTTEAIFFIIKVKEFFLREYIHDLLQSRTIKDQENLQKRINNIIESDLINFIVSLINKISNEKKKQIDNIIKTQAEYHELLNKNQNTQENIIEILKSEYDMKIAEVENLKMQNLKELIILFSILLNEDIMEVPKSEDQNLIIKCMPSKILLQTQKKIIEETFQVTLSGTNINETEKILQEAKKKTDNAIMEKSNEIGIIWAKLNHQGNNPIIWAQFNNNEENNEENDQFVFIRNENTNENSQTDKKQGIQLNQLNDSEKGNNQIGIVINIQTEGIPLSFVDNILPGITNSKARMKSYRISISQMYNVSKDITKEISTIKEQNTTNSNIINILMQTKQDILDKKQLMISRLIKIYEKLIKREDLQQKKINNLNLNDESLTEEIKNNKHEIDEEYLKINEIMDYIYNLTPKKDSLENEIEQLKKNQENKTPIDTKKLTIKELELCIFNTTMNLYKEEFLLYHKKITHILFNNELTNVSFFIESNILQKEQTDSTFHKNQVFLFNQIDQIQLDDTQNRLKSIIMHLTQKLEQEKM